MRLQAVTIGKSNLFAALIEIFRNLYEYDILEVFSCFLKYLYLPLAARRTWYVDENTYSIDRPWP